MFNQNDYPRAYFAGYRLTALLSQSATSQVFLADRTSEAGQQVIIKRLSAISLITERERERFLLEVAFLQQLQHRGILTIIAAGIDKYTPYIIVPYASNGTLCGQLRRRAPMTFTKEEALPILQQIGQALHYAHQRNIIHSNLKPNNILFQNDGQAMLADFAFTSLPATPTHLDINALGSSAYQAPEQPLGEFNKAGDQYALGCIAYEMFTGYRPFTFSSVSTNKYYKEGEEEGLIPPRQLNPEITEQIEQAILTAMRQDPAFRYPSIQEFLMGLGPSSVGARSRKISLHAIDEQDVTASLPAISRPPRITRQESAVLATIRKADLKQESAVLATVRNLKQESAVLATVRKTDLKQESAVLATVRDLRLVPSETPLPISEGTRVNEAPDPLIEITGQFRIVPALATHKLARVTKNSTPLPAIWKTSEKQERAKPEEASTTIIIPRPIRSPYPPFPTDSTETNRQRRKKRYYLLRGMAGAAAVVGIAGMFVITLIQHQPDVNSKQAGIGANPKTPTVTSGKVDTWRAPGAIQNPSNEPIAEGEPGLVPTRGAVGPTPPIVLAPVPTPTETATPQPGDTPTPEPNNPHNPANTPQPGSTNPLYPNNPSYPNNPNNPSYPSYPNNPSYPSNPHNPFNPGNPNNPNNPSYPHNPFNPGNPNNPNNPNNPPQWGGANRGTNRPWPTHHR